MRQRPQFRCIAMLAVLGACGGADTTSDLARCGLPEAAGDVKAVYAIAPANERGSRLIIRGTVFESDGRTPVPGVLIYAYHASRRGVYSAERGKTGCSRWHGDLRGWVRTDSAGRYEFHTNLPGRYPTRREPAHVHMEVLPPGDTTGYWISNLVSASDPYVDRRYRARVAERGGPGIVDFRKGPDGAWYATRNIILNGSAQRR